MRSEISEPAEPEKMLVICDQAFMLEELREKCRRSGLSPSGDKKTLCARLIDVGEEEVLRAIRPYMIERIAAEAREIMEKEES